MTKLLSLTFFNWKELDGISPVPSMSPINLREKKGPKSFINLGVERFGLEPEQLSTHVFLTLLSDYKLPISTSLKIQRLTDTKFIISGSFFDWQINYKYLPKEMKDYLILVGAI